MSIVSLESADEKNVSASILNFLIAYGVISLLSKCGGTKLKGIPVKALFTYTHQCLPHGELLYAEQAGEGS